MCSFLRFAVAATAPVYQMYGPDVTYGQLYCRVYGLVYCRGKALSQRLKEAIDLRLACFGGQTPEWKNDSRGGAKSVDERAAGVGGRGCNGSRSKRAAHSP